MRVTVGENYLLSLLDSPKEDCGSFFVVPSSYLKSPEESKLLKFIKDFYTDNTYFPKIATVNTSLKTDYDPPGGKPDYWHKKLKERYIYTELSTHLPTIIRDVRKDPTGKLGELRNLLEDLTFPDGSKDYHYSDKAESRYEAWKEAAANKGITYVSTGSEVLDNIIHGWRRADVVTLGGRAGIGKTWLVLYLAYLLDRIIPPHLGDILVVSREIPSDEMADRLDCIRFSLPWGEFNAGTLKRSDVSRYRKGAKDLTKHKRRIIIRDNINTIQELEELISVMGPSAVFIDGVYLLEPSMSDGNTRAAYISQNIKRLALSFAIPFIQTVQLRKKTGKTLHKSSLDAQDEFYYGYWVQDSDFALRAYQTPFMVYLNQIVLDFAKGRRVPPNTKLVFNKPLDSMLFNFAQDETDPNEEDYDDEPEKI